MHMDTMEIVEILECTGGFSAGKLCDVISPELYKNHQYFKAQTCLFWYKRESDFEEEWEKNLHL